jgi:3',5'-cyclic AMP phosphodiesterase CpdA
MLIAQLTDTHIVARGEKAYGRVDTAGALRAAVARINGFSPRIEAVFVTGDLTDEGTAAEYDHLAEILSDLAPPFHLAMGNHDDRAALRAAFPDHAYLGSDPDFVHYSLRLGTGGAAWDVVMLDTTVPGRPDGALCEARLDWLERTLAADPDIPALVMQHHPPFETGIAHMDAMRLNKGAQDERTVLDRHTRVRHLACGHVHRAVTGMLGRVPVSIAPSPAHSVALSLDPDAGAELTMEPALLRLFRLGPHGDLVTHLAPVTPPDGPHGF